MKKKAIIISLSLFVAYSTVAGGENIIPNAISKQQVKIVRSLLTSYFEIPFDDDYILKGYINSTGTNSYAYEATLYEVSGTGEVEIGTAVYTFETHMEGTEEVVTETTIDDGTFSDGGTEAVLKGHSKHNVVKNAIANVR